MVAVSKIGDDKSLASVPEVHRALIYMPTSVSFPILASSHSKFPLPLGKGVAVLGGATL